MILHKTKIRIITYIALIFLLSTACSTKREKLPVDGLVERIAPQFADDIVFEQIESPSGNDIFELENLSAGKIVIRGNNPIAMSVGFNHYLKYYCKSTVSWNADQPVQLPEVLPAVPEKVESEARVDKRFFLNYCTYGYTMPYWKWNDWERLIDWMALNGINMPLAISGQESILYKVWSDMGLTDEEIRGYFTGPAHLPWNRMSNIDKIGGPLPYSFMDHDFKLQKKILEKERLFGMTPVLPAFNGHVPEKLKRVFPNAKISRLGNADGLENPYSCYMLNPMDSLFKKIQKAFLEEQIEQFGTDHIYGIDPLNEVQPSSWDSEYLANLSKTIYESVAEVDPEAEWLQMGWMFHFSRKHWTNERIDAFVNAVPQDKMILLDYFCENNEIWKMTDSFFCQPYIWNYLGNFGGNTVLAGNIEEAGKRLENALKNGGDNLQGIGSTLEGFDVNPMVYEYIFEKAWTTKSDDLDTWFDKLADRRCGTEDKNYRNAWRILKDIIYTKQGTLTEVPITNLRPAFVGDDRYWAGWDKITYSNKDLFNAWELMLKAEKQDFDAYNYDIVNVGRQVLVNYFAVLNQQFTAAYRNRDLKLLKNTGNEMGKVLLDLDKLLSTHRSFLLGKWIEDARAIAKDSTEADYYEKNARLIITSFAGIYHSLNDYANRNWAGLTESFYAERWRMFIADAVKAVENNTEFNKKEFLDEELKFEREWENSSQKVIVYPVGSSVEIANNLLEKYRKEIN